MVRRFLFPITLLANSLIFAGNCSGIAKADAIPSGTLPAEYCFSITNVNRYPDYSFYAEIISAETSKATSKNLINAKGCYGANEGQSIQVFAQKRSKQSSALSNNQRINYRPPIKQATYFRTSYGVKKARDLLRVKLISPTELKLEYTEIIYTFKNGKQQRKVYRNQQEKPQPSISKSSLNLWYLANSAIAIGIVVLFYRQSQLSRDRDRSASSDLDN